MSFLCVSVCACLCETQCVPVRSPLAAGRCARNRERQCECVCRIMKSSQHALQCGSTVKPWRCSSMAVAEPGAVRTAALKQQCTSCGGEGLTLLDVEQGGNGVDGTGREGKETEHKGTEGRAQ